MKVQQPLQNFIATTIYSISHTHSFIILDFGILVPGYLRKGTGRSPEIRVIPAYTYHSLNSNPVGLSSLQDEDSPNILHSGRQLSCPITEIWTSFIQMLYFSFTSLPPSIANKCTLQLYPRLSSFQPKSNTTAALIGLCYTCRSLFLGTEKQHLSYASSLISLLVRLSTLYYQRDASISRVTTFEQR